jgi:hypothetical protein
MICINALASTKLRSDCRNRRSAPTDGQLAMENRYPGPPI